MVLLIVHYGYRMELYIPNYERCKAERIMSITVIIAEAIAHCSNVTRIDITFRCL